MLGDESSCAPTNIILDFDVQANGRGLPNCFLTLNTFIHPPALSKTRTSFNPCPSAIYAYLIALFAFIFYPRPSSPHAYLLCKLIPIYDNLIFMLILHFSLSSTFVHLLHVYPPSILLYSNTCRRGPSQLSSHTPYHPVSYLISCHVIPHPNLIFFHFSYHLISSRRQDDPLPQPTSCDLFEFIISVLISSVIPSHPILSHLTPNPIQHFISSSHLATHPILSEPTSPHIISLHRSPRLVS